MTLTLLTGLLLGVAGPAVAAESDPDPLVARYQHALARAGFYRGGVDGLDGPQTRAAVLAFEKAAGLPTDGRWEIPNLAYLRNYESAITARPDEPDRLEIDLTNQVGYLILAGELVGTFGVSSGNGEVYRHPHGFTGVANTPRGDFQLYRHFEGTREAPLGQLYRPWYFRGGFAIHGSGSVPSYPASHGCIRVNNWEADWLAGHLFIGMPIHIWDGEPNRRPRLESQVLVGLSTGLFPT